MTTRHILLAPDYQDCRKTVEEIIDRFSSDGAPVHLGRNSIKTFTTRLGVWNVKRYHKPNWINRIAYTWLRKPKGLRAFEYPQRVLAAGYETPAPIAYVEERQLGLLSYSYFVSEQCKYERRFYEFGGARVQDCQEILKSFAHFTAGLHEAGILHRDYSPGNILFDKIDGTWHFSIVDINRMRFGPVSIEKGCANFARLWGQPDWFRYLARAYAQERGADPNYCEHLVLQARYKFWKPRAKHNKLPYTIRF